MSKIIDGDVMSEIDVYESDDILTIDFYDTDSLHFDKDGAKGLMEILKEWVEDDT